MGGRWMGAGLAHRPATTHAAAAVAYSDYTQHQFFPPSAQVAIQPCICLQRMRCNSALIIRRLASQLYVGLATFDVATRRTCSAGCKRINVLVKVYRTVWGCADLNDQD